MWLLLPLVVAVDSAFGDITGIGVLWVPAVVVVYAVAGVHASILVNSLAGPLMSTTDVVPSGIKASFLSPYF